jgi:hypothetical protein
VPKDGRYRVRFWYNPQANRSESVPVSVRHARGEEIVRVNQRMPPMEEGIGLFHFSAAQPAVVEVRAADATPGHVIVDAVQFVPVE